jgi:hypothetical protein
MNVPLQSPPVIRSSMNAKHSGEVIAQECYCLGTPPNCTWHCHWGRDFVDTGYQCTCVRTPEATQGKWKKTTEYDDRVECKAGGVTMVAQKVEHDPYTAT